MSEAAGSMDAGQQGDVGQGQQEGNETPWVDTLPESVRDWDEVKNSKDADTFWNQVTNMRSRMGRSITIPGEDASDDERSAFYEKIVKNAPGVMPRPDMDNEEAMSALYESLGRPEAPDKYAAPEIGEVPDGVDISKDRIEMFRGVAHKYNLTQKQFEGVVSEIVGGDIAAAAESQVAYNQAHADLKTEWGLAYDEKRASADKIREEFFPFIPKEAMNADTLRSLANVASQLGPEGTNMTNDSAKAKSATMTPDEAEEKIGEIMRNKQHPYWIPSDPAHKAAKSRMRNLHKMAYPGE